MLRQLVDLHHYWTQDQRARYLDLGPQGVRIDGYRRRGSLRLHFLNDTTTPCRIPQRRLTPSAYDINTLRWLWFWTHKACVSKAIDFLNDAALPCRLPVLVDSSSGAPNTAIQHLLAMDLGPQGVRIEGYRRRD